MIPPDTRLSLLFRVKDTADGDAWREFAKIYRPVICRLAARRGLQPADAEDLAQQVLIAIAGAIERWEPNQSRAKFRTWVRRIAENAILNALTRGFRDPGSGSDDVRVLLEQEPANSADSDQLQAEYRREVFAWAAGQIRDEFSDQTWSAFWLTAVDGLNVEEAIHQLGCTRGSVYASRSRVMRRLKEKVGEFDDE